VPPRERPVSPPPNPRRPKLKRDLDGGILGDLFAIFPDLPRAPKPPSRQTRPTPLSRRRSKLG
jgi:hypothetical protein